MPTKRLQAADVTEHLRDRILAAEEIWFVDPNQGTGQDNKHPWMELVISVPPPIPEVVDPSTPQTEPVILEIEVDSRNHDELLEIRERIKKLAGAEIGPAGPV